MALKSVFSKVAAVSLLSAGFLASPLVNAQALPVQCEGYKQGPSKVPGQRVGKKVQAAFEAYSADLTDEAIAILKEIEAKNEYDKAFVNRFLANLLAAKEGQASNARDYLLSAVSTKILNDGDHAVSLRLVADLSLQLQKYDDALVWYQKWIDFTCKQEPDVYTRMAQAYFETKQMDKVAGPADKAIALYEKPNKNPYVLKMTAFFELKKYKETIKVAETLVKLFPETGQWWSQLAFFYMLVEDYQSALRTFELAYAQGFVTKAQQIKSMAQLYGTLEMPYKSATLQEKYLKSGVLERNVDTLARIANAYHRSKDFLKAAKYYGDAAELSGDPEHYRKQGALLLTAEKYPEAIVAMKKSLDNGSKKKGSIHMALMEANFYQAKFKQAYVHANEAAKDKSTARTARAWTPYIKEKAKNRGIKI